MGRVRRIFGAAWITWLLAGAGDQVLGIYERLPERLRGWIEGYVMAPVVGALTLVAFLIWGLIEDLENIYLAALLLVAVCCVMVIAVIAQWAVTWIKREAFTVTPVSVSGVQVGIGEDLINPERVYARMGVTSKRDVGRCVAVVTGISSYERQIAVLGLMTQLLWNARFLAWTPEENRRRQATLLTGITMTADLAVCHRSEPDHFQITSADDGIRHKFPQGLYKIDVTVMSESGGGARRDVSMALTFELDPGVGQAMRRLIVQPWRDEFVKHKQEEDAERRRRKGTEAATAKAVTPSLSPPSGETASNQTPSHEVNS